MNKRIQAQMQKMDEQQELLLARLLAEEAQQLTERAKTRGVTAYLEKPTKRLRPNQRFLQNTLGNIRSANKRVEEDEMWDRRELQRARESSAARKRSRSPSAASPSSPCTRSSTDASPSPARHTDQDALRNSNQCGAGDAAHGEMQENDVQAWLAQRRVRGRGGVGSLVDEAAEEASPVPSPQQKKHKYRKKKKHKKHKKKKKKMKADHTSDSSD